MTAPAVFLDRDGVLNDVIVRDGKPYPPDDLSQTRLLPGVEDACRHLREAGFLLICVTNQPDLARGKQTRARVDQINGFLTERLKLDAVLVCDHDDDDRCACRKPKPGLLIEGAARFGVDLGCSVMVGDRWRDVGAGQAAGCRTVFIDRLYREQRPDHPDLVVDSLAAAVPWILSVTNRQSNSKRSL